MNHPVERRTAPSPRGAAGTAPASLVDLMCEGFYALFLLKSGCGPQEQAAFADRMTGFLGEVDRSAFYGTPDQWTMFLLTGCDPRALPGLGPTGRCNSQK